MGKVALVTGINGQDGHYMASYLLQQGYTVYGSYRGSAPPADLPEGVRPLPLELGDAGRIAAVIKSLQPNELYNFAGISSVPHSFANPDETLSITGAGPVRIFEAVRQFSPHTKVFQASSSEMFGVPTSLPLSCSSPMHPISPYGVAKLMAHLLADYYRTAYGLFLACGISFNHESPRRNPAFVTRKISLGVARIKAGLQQRLELGNVAARRDWGSAVEYVQGFHRLLQIPVAQDCVFATGVDCSVEDFARECFQEMGLRMDEHLVGNTRPNMRETDIPILLGDTKQAKALLGWQAKTPVQEIAREMVRADYERVKEGWNVDATRALDAAHLERVL